MSKCPTMRAFNKQGKVQNVYCGSWSCPRCQKLKARLWAWRIKLTIRDSNVVWYFWTLTLRSKYRDPKSGYDALPRLWDTLRKQVQRHEKKFSYLAFVEGQPKRGNMPHFHVITNVKPWTRFKDIAWYAGFGYEAKSEKVTGPKAGSYVAKYATKQNADTPKGFRRVRASRDIAKLPDYDKIGLIVPAKNERQWEYIARVSDETGIDHETLYERWVDGLDDSEAVDK